MVFCCGAMLLMFRLAIDKVTAGHNVAEGGICCGLMRLCSCS